MRSFRTPQALQRDGPAGADLGFDDDGLPDLFADFLHQRADIKIGSRSRCERTDVQQGFAGQAFAIAAPGPAIMQMAAAIAQA